MNIRKRLAMLLAVLVGVATSNYCTYAAESPTPASLVNVRLNADFHPELEFRIAEAFRRPPIGWRLARDHTFAEVSEPVAPQVDAEELISQWDAMWENNPAHTVVAEKVDASEIEKETLGIEMQMYVQEHLRSTLEQLMAMATPVHPADLISLSDLPQVNTGEEVIAQLEAEYARFPLDPYGYDEYNGYFEPEVYDWFVFVTDDLTVVYVHENSDFEVPLIADEEAISLPAEVEVPEAFKIAVRDATRALFAGEIELSQIVDRAQTQWNVATRPIWSRYVTHNELLRVERIAQLRELLRF